MRLSTVCVAPALFLLALATPDVQAQLYTWKDAEGNSVIKNSPPPWYSPTDRPRGARVQVLRNGKVVDDTAWPAPQRQEGRNQEAREEAKRARSDPAPPRSAKSDEDDD